MANLVSLRGNSVPQGGMTNPSPAAGDSASAAQPATLEELLTNLQPAVVAFRKVSSPLSVDLDEVAVSGSVAGKKPAVRLANVGLGYRILREHTATVTLDNTAATAVTVNLGYRFPWDLIDETQLKINGGGVPYDCGGWGGLLVYARQRPGFWKPTPLNAQGLSPAWVRLSVVNGTLNLPAAGVYTPSGYASVTIAAATTATLTAIFYTVEKIAKDRTGLIGALPLQNNQTFSQLITTLQPTLTGDQSTSPFWITTGIPGTLSIVWTAHTILGSYKFWSVPADQALYAEMIANSYQVQEDSNISQGSTGSQAFRYDMPQNCYFGAAHLQVTDANGNPMPFGDFSPLQLVYNAKSIQPVTQYARRERAENYGDYDADLGIIPVYVIWDGDNTSESIQDTDDAGWINTYKVAKPQIICTVAPGLAVPADITITREVLVPESVIVTGG